MSESTLEVVRHPLIEHQLSFLRDSRTGTREFTEGLERVTLLLTSHATRGLEGEEVTIETPLETTRARRIREDRLVVVPILRAGLGMVEGVRKLIPGVRVGHLGFYRNEETLQPVRYYGKLPPDSGSFTWLVVDPMLGTGGTAVAAVAELKAHGATDIRMMCLVALSRRRGPHERTASGRARVHGGAGPATQPGGVHRSRSWRCRRPAVRDGLIRWPGIGRFISLQTGP